MNMSDIVPALEQAAAVLADLVSTSAELSGAAESARASARSLDDALARHPARKAEIFGAIAPPAPPASAYRLRARSIGETIDAVLAHGCDYQTLMAQHEIASWIAAALDVRSRDAAKAEAARDEARKPFVAETKRAHEFAKRFAEYPTLAARIVSLFRSDVLIARFGSSAYSRVPVRGSHINFERTIRLPRMLATPERLTATRLLGYWPPKYSDFSGLESVYYHDTDNDLIAGPIYELSQKGTVSNEDVDRVVARATTLMVSEYSKVCATIRELLALDDQITAADRDGRYPDGALIFDPAMFPTHWQIGVMNKTFNGFPRIALPGIDGMAMAAE
jgi:hypothetical protein